MFYFFIALIVMVIIFVNVIFGSLDRLLIEGDILFILLLLISGFSFESVSISWCK